MSNRYQGAWLQDGAFNPLAAPTPSYSYYLYTWGRNNSGQLGTNNLTYYSSPKQLGALTNWASASSGKDYHIAIKTDGTLWSWGANDSGQLGLGNRTYYSSPKQVGSLTNWLSVTCGIYSTVSIKTDGTLWTWGNNTYGQLGLNNTTAYSSPKQVGSLTNWSKLGSAAYTIFAIKTDGTLWVWGGGFQGANGLGNRTNYSSPKQVGSLTNWASTNSNSSSGTVTAIKTDGTLWSWGANSAGQLGLGNRTYYSSPKQVGSLTNWSVNSVGVTFTNFIKTDGTLWTCGSNTYGQLGLGTSGNYTDKSSPTQVGSLTTWSKTSNGYYFAMAIKTDGTLWSWGYNSVGGALGLNNTTNYSSPKQVGSLTTWRALPNMMDQYSALALQL